jgi:hypothetical protein
MMIQFKGRRGSILVMSISSTTTSIIMWKRSRFMQSKGPRKRGRVTRMKGQKEKMIPHSIVSTLIRFSAGFNRRHQSRIPVDEARIENLRVREKRNEDNRLARTASLAEANNKNGERGDGESICPCLSFLLSYSFCRI